MDDAKITAVSTRVGLPAEYGMGWILPRLMGVTRASDVLLSGRILRAGEMRHMGLFNQVFPRAEFDTAVVDYARGLAQCPPSAVTTTKRQIWGDLLHADPAGAVERSKELIETHMRHPDYKEGVAAVVARRAPAFG